ncbi:MAG: hypothetical protein RSE41_05610 [Clostridia bacterium]
MSLRTPIILDIPAFDANNPMVIKFNVFGGDQVVANELTIFKSDGGAPIYQNKITSYRFEQTIPANLLTNGFSYRCFFTTFNVAGEQSRSNYVLFYCYSTPTIVFTNIPYSGVIDNTFYEFNAQYLQQQGEPIKSVYFYLYDESHNLIETSKVLSSLFNYTFNNFINGNTYYIQAKGITIYNTEFFSNLEKFHIEYQYNGIFAEVKLKNNCTKGYVEVRNELITIDGISNPSPPIYLDNNTKIDLSSDASYVEWKQGFSFSEKGFIISEWLKPALWGNILYLYSERRNDRIEIALRRGIPQGEIIPKDYYEMIGYHNDIEYFYQRSNYIEVINNNTDIIEWSKKNIGAFDLILKTITGVGTKIIWNGESNAQYNIRTSLSWVGESLTSVNTVIEWNGNSNVEFNKITDIFWIDEIKAPTITRETYYTDDTYFAEFTDVVLENSVVEHFNITKDINKIYSEEKPIWDFSTIIDCDFNGNINGGNLIVLLNQLDNLRIKRRRYGTFNWIIIGNIPINTVQDLITARFEDSYAPSGIEFEYAIAPTMKGLESSLYKAQIKTFFDGIFLSDITGNILKLYSGTMYPNYGTNRAISSLKAIGSKYPVIIENSAINYQTMGVVGNILGIDFEQTRKIDRNKIVEQREHYSDILNNGKAKILKDWNGNILLCRVTTAPTFSYNGNYGMAVPSINFEVTEQGKYDNQEDLYETGLVKR